MKYCMDLTNWWPLYDTQWTLLDPPPSVPQKTKSTTVHNEKLYINDVEVVFVVIYRFVFTLNSSLFGMH